MEPLDSVHEGHSWTVAMGCPQHNTHHNNRNKEDKELTHSIFATSRNTVYIQQRHSTLFAYFAFDQHHIRFCAACSNCASLSVLETPDMEELLSDYEDEILDRGGCSTFTDYIQHAQEGHNFTDPYLTYSENKDVSIPVYFPRKVQQIHLTNTRHYCTCINRLISASLATFPM